MGFEEAVGVAERPGRRKLQHDVAIDVILGAEGVEDALGRFGVTLAKGLERFELFVEVIQYQRLGRGRADGLGCGAAHGVVGLAVCLVAHPDSSPLGRRFASRS